MSDFIRIQSKQSIVVTPGLNYKDVTNYDSDIPDRLKIAATWPKASVLITEGVGTYPAEIAEWSTVKALIANGIITIGGETEETEPAKIEKAKDLKRALEEIAKDEAEAPKKRGKKKTLEEVAE